MSGRIRVSFKADRTLDGIVFDSKAEMNRYAELRMLERAKVIRNLERQPTYPLIDAFVYRGEKIRAITYRADFRYIDVASGDEIVEDCKGMKTEVYKLKKKLLLARYPQLNFREVQA